VHHATQGDGSPSHDLELRLAPLAVALILLTTAIPIDVGRTAGWNARLDLGDVVQNFVLYMPLGIALRRWSVWRVAIVAGALSFLIESAQVWQLGRFASPVDLGINLAGAVVAAALSRRFGDSSAGSGCACVRITASSWSVVGALGLVVLAGLSTFPKVQAASSLPNWNTSYPLLLGNERTSGRPWRGRIEETEVFVPASLRDSAKSAFSYRPTGRISLDGGPAIALPTDAAKSFAEAAIGARAFGVRLTIATADIGQSGPARLISFSSDTLNRNFDLGQSGRRLIFRIRTPVSGSNGEEHRAESAPVLAVGRSIAVLARYDGSVARIYVDGRLAGRSNLAAAGCRIPALCDLAAPTVWGVVAGLLMVVALLVLPVRAPLAVGLAAFAVGVATIAVVRLMPAYPLLAGAAAPIALATFLGPGAVAAAGMRFERREPRDTA
jgi:hypothetical protein